MEIERLESAVKKLRESYELSRDDDMVDAEAFRPVVQALFRMQHNCVRGVPDRWTPAGDPV